MVCCNRHVVIPLGLTRSFILSTPVCVSAAKSAKFSCDAVIEIVTPESAAASNIDRMVGDEDVEIKPKWYPGPEQVQGWGYLHNMGYPEYYRGSSSGPVDCRWTIRATHGRRVRLTLLDLSIRSEYIVELVVGLFCSTLCSFEMCNKWRGNLCFAGVLHGEQECKDVVTVTEHSRLLLNKCGQVEEPLVIESSSDEMNITLSVKSQFIPKRGLMAYFTGEYFTQLKS